MSPHAEHGRALAQRTFPIPAFGENLSIAGGLETEVCIGDRYTNGDAIVEISQPSERCGTPGRSLKASRAVADESAVG